MWKSIIDFCRQHIVATMITTLLFGWVPGGIAVVYSLYQAKVNRVEDMKVRQYELLSAENEKFLLILNRFTAKLATSGEVDLDQKDEMSESLARLYYQFGMFAINLPKASEQPLRDLQSSINEVKKQVQLVDSKADLDPLSVALVHMFRNLKAVQPLIESAVGKPIAPISGEAHQG